MRAFYMVTGVGIVVLLGVATTLLLLGRRRPGDWWLAGFLLSLISNAVWAIIGPILAGWENTQGAFEIGNFVSRVICFCGYAALVGFVVVRKRGSN